jgi:hypothetical protein
MNDAVLDACAVMRAQLRGDHQGMEAILTHAEWWNVTIALAALVVDYIDDPGEREHFDAYLAAQQRGRLRARLEDGEAQR